jgi:hypothetical protein
VFAEVKAEHITCSWAEEVESDRYKIHVSTTSGQTFYFFSDDPREIEGLVIA